jgi:sulfite reductase (NADPH) flavoprotein alpha-component
MNQMTPPPKIEIIPTSAPFSEAQRSWLNGFFAGLLSTDSPAPLSPEQAATVIQGPGGDGDDEAPWHDQTLPIAERMKLAEGRPLRRRMMAAMAQQDCGQCGYNCNDYSVAIASRAEARLNLCVPGGKETGAGDIRGAGAFARQSGRGDIRLAPAPEQARIGKGNLAHRFRS